MDGPKVKPARMHIADDFFDHHFCFQRLSVVFRTWPWRGRPYVEANACAIRPKSFCRRPDAQIIQGAGFSSKCLLVLHFIMPHSRDQPILPLNFFEWWQHTPQIYRILSILISFQKQCLANTVQANISSWAHCMGCSNYVIIVMK